ncbi:MAG TPA: hypothetical protein VGI05_01560 [Streptosporangiaceae bacterium]
MPVTAPPGSWLAPAGDTLARALAPRGRPAAGCSRLLRHLAPGGDLDRAAGLHQQALERSEQLGGWRLAIVVLGNLGLVAARPQELPRRRAVHLRSLHQAESVGERRSVAEMPLELAAVESAAGSAAWAATLSGVSQAIRQDIGAPTAGPDQARLNGARDAAAAALGEEAFSAAHQAGPRLSAEQAVAQAKDGSWPPLTPAKPA